MGLGSTYNDMIIKGSGLAVWNLTPGATFLFFVLVLLLNPLLRLLHPRLPLQRGELAVAFFLILLANTLSGRGLPAQLLPVITGAYYYATPENGWAEIVQPYMPDWPVPQSRDAIWGFYEGDPTGAVPWAIWAAPLLYWAVFGLAPLSGDALPNGNCAAAMGGARAPSLSHGPASLGHDRRRRSRTDHQTPVPQRVYVAWLFSSPLS